MKPEIDLETKKVIEDICARINTLLNKNGTNKYTAYFEQHHVFECYENSIMLSYPENIDLYELYDTLNTDPTIESDLIKIKVSIVPICYCEEE